MPRWTASRRDVPASGPGRHCPRRLVPCGVRVSLHGMPGHAQRRCLPGRLGASQPLPCSAPRTNSRRSTTAPRQLRGGRQHGCRSYPGNDRVLLPRKPEGRGCGTWSGLPRPGTRTPLYSLAVIHFNGSGSAAPERKLSVGSPALRQLSTAGPRGSTAGAAGTASRTGMESRETQQKAEGSQTEANLRAIYRKAHRALVAASGPGRRWP